MRALHKKLDLATYAHDKMARFKLSGRPDSEEGVSVPIPIMYRYYHIGRAYDLHQLKNFSPNGCSTLDFISMKLLVSELGALKELVNDVVLDYYSDQLVHYINGPCIETKSRITLSV
jgi:hypothetical protein